MNLFDYLYWEATVIMREKEGDWSITCALCSDSALFDAANSWQETLDESRQAGWKSVQINGAWDSICPTCAEREEQKALEKQKRKP